MWDRSILALRVLFQRMATYPLLFPFMLGYSLTKNSRISDHFYSHFCSIRSIPHGFPLRHGLRMASFDGKKLLFPCAEDAAFDDVFLRRVYYPYQPKHEDVVVDVGAHMGFFAVKTAKHVRKVVAFEPDPESFRFLIFNAKNNNLSNVVAYNYALGETDGFMFLERGEVHGRSKITSDNVGIKVKVRALDSVIKELGISPTVIKIDTEGYELEVLKGARYTLVHSGPTLVIASYHYRDETKKVAKLLKELNFTVFTYRVPLVLQRAKETYVYAVSPHA